MRIQVEVSFVASLLGPVMYDTSCMNNTHTHTCRYIYIYMHVQVEVSFVATLLGPVMYDTPGIYNTRTHTYIYLYAYKGGGELRSVTSGPSDVSHILRTFAGLAFNPCVCPSCCHLCVAATPCTTLHHIAPHCTTLHHTAPLCNTLTHPACHCCRSTMPVCVPLTLLAGGLGHI